MADAQYAAPPSRLNFPSPSPTPAAPAQPTETPAAPPTPTPTASPTPNKPATQPRRSILIEKPVHAVEPRSSATPSPAGRPLLRRLPAQPSSGRRASRPTFDFSQDNWATAMTIRSLERKWEAAIKDHDSATIEKLLAQDFRGVSASGRGGSRATILREIKRDKHVYKSAKVRAMEVHNSAPDVATVTGTAIETGTTEDGKRFTSTRRFTDTWRMRKGSWECVTSRVSKAAKE